MRDIDTGGAPFAYAGRDLYQDRGWPPIKADIQMLASPLLRLDLNQEIVDAWISARRAHLQKRIIPPRPQKPSYIHPTQAIYRSFQATSDYDEDLAEFGRRLEQHLTMCRSRLVQTIMAAIYGSRMNKVAFVVRNLSDESMEGVQLHVEFKAPKVRLSSSRPSAKAMPKPPTWPHFSDKFGNQSLGLSQAVIDAASMSPLRPGPSVDITRGHDDHITMRFQVGQIGPGLTGQTPSVTFVVLPGYDVPDPIDIDVLAWATNRRNRVETRLKATVSERRLMVGDLVHPDY